MPISEIEFEGLLPNLGLSESGKVYIKELRSTEPARRVQSRVLANCCYRYVSKRMGFALMAESHLEYRFLLRCEFGFDGLLEYWEQPTSIGIKGIDKRGRFFRTGYVADVIAIFPNEVRTYEVKYVEKCLKLNAERPNDWLRTALGFEYRPARDAFRDLGIKHLVITDGDLNSIESSNYDLLLHARSAPTPADEDKLIHHTATLLATEKVLTIAALQRHLGIVDMTATLKMIERGFLTAKLDLCPLSSIHDAWVALDPSTLGSFLTARQLMGHERKDSEPLDTSQVPCAKNSVEMLERLKQLQGLLPQTSSKRTLRRWRARLKHDSNPSALLSRRSRQGNRSSRISASHEKLIESVLQRFYNSANNWKPYRCYGAYLHELKQQYTNTEHQERPMRALSFRAFLTRIKKLDPQTSALARGGKRAANAAAPPVDVAQRSLLAQRPFQRAHLDHAKLDVHVKIMETGGRMFTLRPWLTIMVDEYSRAVLAMTLGFRAPSRRACSLILRDCVRRHGRMPETMVVDNGKEFESVYFEACLARLGVNKQSRPPGHPRYGTTVERVFGTLNDELLLTLPGNTSNIATDRGKSTSHKGMNRAEISLLELHEFLHHYFFELFNEHASGSHLQSPNALERDGLRLFASSGRAAEIDMAFLVETAIECPRRLTMDPQRGVRHNGRFYNHALLHLPSNKSSFEAREEPWDEHRIYVRARDGWVTCHHGPHQNSQLFSNSQICASTLWLESSSMRAAAKVGRLVATMEVQDARQREQSKQKEKVSGRQAMQKQQAWGMELPPLPKHLIPLPKIGWEES